METTLDKHLKEFESHFEFIDEDHADIFDAATAVPVYGQAYGIARSIGGALGNVFGGKKEDTSDTGYQQFVQSGGAGNLSFFPTLAEMIKAAQNGKYETGGKSDGSEQAAISASYNPSAGTYNHGDWKGIVTSTNPIKWQIFKGSGEKHNFTSSVNAKVPANQTPSQAVAAPQQSSVPTVTANVPVSSPVQGQPAQSVPVTFASTPLQSAPTAATAAMTQTKLQRGSHPSGNPHPDNTQQQSQQPIGAASLVDQVKSMLPAGQPASSNQTMLYIGLGAALIVVVLVLALKK